MQQLTPDWQHWVIENMALGVTSALISDTLRDRGFNTQEIRIALDVASIPGVRAAMENWQRKYEKLAWILGNYESSARVSPATSMIERRERLSGDEFYAEYYARGRPVVLTGTLGDWARGEYWTLDRLKRDFGQHEIEVQDGRLADPHYEQNSVAYKARTSFATFVDRVAASGGGNDFYMTARNTGASAAFVGDVLRDVVMPTHLCDDAKRDGRLFFWFGPMGTVTPLHHDLTNNGMVQLQGRKRVKLVSPNQTPLLYNVNHCYSEIDIEAIDVLRFPKAKAVHALDVVLEAGEILFIPIGWWHHVRALDVSVTLSFTHFRDDNTYIEGYNRLYGTI